jgi:AcrR family transcriptional regulator
VARQTAEAPGLGRAVPEVLAERLFEAAFALFASKGFERTTMDDVAAQAGVARATLYYYFRGKDELFEFLLRRGVSLLGAALEEATAGGRTARERLERALDRMVDLMAEHATVLRVAMQQFGRIAADGGEAHAWLHDRSTRGLAGILAGGARDGTLRRVDPEAAALAIFGATCWVCLHELETADRVRTGQVKRLLRTLFVEGLGAPAAG